MSTFIIRETSPNREGGRTHKIELLLTGKFENLKLKNFFEEKN